MDNGLQLLNIHLDAAIACKTNNATPFCKGNSNRRGKVIAHGCRAGVGDKPLSELELASLIRDDACGGVAADHSIVGAESIEETVDEVVRIERRAALLLLFENDRKLCLPFFAPVKPLFVGLIGAMRRIL